MINIKNIIIALLLGAIITHTLTIRTMNCQVKKLKSEVNTLMFAVYATSQCIKELTKMIEQEKVYVF
jgi:hypothetical protein